MPKTTPTVCIVESLGFLEEATHREGEIISRTLRLSLKESRYTYLRTVDELRAFAIEFGDSNHRYLHISCHGSGDAFSTTTGPISATELAGLLAPHVRKRRVFVSSCLAADSEFATTLLLSSECLSVLAPVGTIRFDDAAIFWSAFYHLVFKENPDAMTRTTIERNVENAAALVGQQFRLFYKSGNNVRQKLLGPS